MAVNAHKAEIKGKESSVTIAIIVVSGCGYSGANILQTASSISAITNVVMLFKSYITLLFAFGISQTAFEP